MALALAGPRSCLTAGPARAPRGGQIEYETVSEFSRIRVRRQAGVRTLTFVRDNGTRRSRAW